MTKLDPRLRGDDKAGVALLSSTPIEVVRLIGRYSLVVATLWMLLAVWPSLADAAVVTRIKPKPWTPFPTQETEASQLEKEKDEDEFVYLKFAEVNLRAGPGTRYPIKWVVKSSGEPVKVVERFYQWIHIETITKQDGWIQLPMTSRKRIYAIVVEKDSRPVVAYAAPTTKARRIMRLEPGARVNIVKCAEIGWCRVLASGIKAWVDKKNLWGV